MSNIKILNTLAETVFEAYRILKKLYYDSFFIFLTSSAVIPEYEKFFYLMVSSTAIPKCEESLFREV